MKLITLYDKIEKLVQRLPDTLQKPILREITPIKTLFLLQRPPRFALLGERSADKAELINAIFRAEVLPDSADMLHDGTWQTLTLRGRGTLRLLDARRPVSAATAKTALAAEPPDVYLLVRGTGAGRGFKGDLEHAAQLLEFAEARHPARPPLLAIQLGAGSRDSLPTSIHDHPVLAARLAQTLRFSGSPADIATVVGIIASLLPEETRLETARLSGDRELQSQLARTVVRSVTAICGAVGTQPIPLADFPILTSLQASMVAAIMHISGREMSMRLAGEFMAAMGASVGAALVLREGARAVLKFVPIWGDFVSGAIAAGGTYAIGRAASAYFVEGMSLKQARELFRKKRPRPMLEP
jgi:uncharacterized protein (DUF697 family)